MTMPRLIPDHTRKGSWMVRIDGIDQSYVDLADPTHLEFDYMRRIGDHIDQHAPEGERLRVVHVGGAGMTLARYVATTRPTSPQIVFEPDVSLTEEVREHAPLPKRSGIKVRPMDGYSGIESLADDYAEVVITDAFVDGSVPGEFVTVDYFAELSRVLVGDGLALFNLTDRHHFEWTKRVVAGLVTVFPQVVVSADPASFRARRFTNLVAAASIIDHPEAALTRRFASAAFPSRLIASDEIASFISGAKPFVASDTQASPPPAVKLTWFG